MTSRSWGRSGRAWSTEINRMKAGRQARPPVREERLRTAGAGRNGARLSAWRGVSGRRYVVVVYPIDGASGLEAPGSVILGVRRGADGIAHLVGVGHLGSVADAVVFARLDRANEIHLHRLADTTAERDAIVEDLVGDDAL